MGLPEDFDAQWSESLYSSYHENLIFYYDGEKID